jgi:hypothetical protein
MNNSIGLCLKPFNICKDNLVGGTMAHYPHHNTAIRSQLRSSCTKLQQLSETPSRYGLIYRVQEEPDGRDNAWSYYYLFTAEIPTPLWAQLPEDGTALVYKEKLSKMMSGEWCGYHQLVWNIPAPREKLCNGATALNIGSVSS